MRILLFSVAYLLAGLLLQENRGAAIITALIFGLAMLGASRLSGVADLRQFTAWARKYPVDGCMAVFLPTAFGAMSLFIGIDIIKSALSVPVAFAWFWLFVAVGTRLKERSLKKAVDAELARRAGVQGEGDAL